MNEKSILTRADYEDYLVRVYFTNMSDHLLSCIERAFLDLSRTLHGLHTHKSKDQLKQQANNDMRVLFNELQSGQTQLTTQTEFDVWHRSACQHLSARFVEYGYHQLFIGQAQKWLNMTFKYIYVLGEQRLSGFGAVYSFCHVPLDSILLEQLRRYGFPQLSCAWSRLNDYNQYLAYQEWMRHHFTLAPLDVEFLLWLRRDVTVYYRASMEV